MNKVTQQMLFPYIKTLSDLKRLICMENFRPNIPDDFPASIKSLLRNCWQSEQDARPKFDEIHSILTDVIYEVTLLQDLEAISFWKDSFSGREFVEFKEFIGAFASRLKERALTDAEKEVFQLLIGSFLFLALIER